MLSLEQICQMLVGTARTCGIQIVKTLDPVEHEEFMKQRRENVEKFMEELKEAKSTKILRTT